MKTIDQIVLFSSIVLFLGCNSVPQSFEISKSLPDIYPDYTNLTIPVNIAPLNFMMTNAEQIVANYYGKEKSFSVRGKDRIDISVKKWKKLLQTNVGDTIWLEITAKQSGYWVQYPKTMYFVSPDSIDPYLVYRKIAPGFNEWNLMGLYQRNLESFEEEPIITNAHTKKNCMNCHTFCMNDPNAMVFHFRQKYGGTCLLSNGVLSRLETKTDQTISNCVYPYWHPSGKFIAFSTNLTSQSIHARHDLNIEVYDSASDIVILDMERNELFTDSLISLQHTMETYPAFSPDGKKLFFCSSVLPKKLPEDYHLIKYSMCCIDFDPETKKFGEKADTLISSCKVNKSVSFAHPSPDGKYMLCTLSDYGCFPSWNDESDLYLFDLETFELTDLHLINSPYAEGFTSWSSNGKWISFSSRRDDRQYSRLFFSHIDQSVTSEKAFVLPQKNPENNIMNLYSFNKPELVKAKLSLKPREIVKMAKTKSTQVNFAGKSYIKNASRRTETEVN